MNQKLKQLDIEKILFWDLECVREHETLDPNSEEYSLFEQKTRDKEKDQMLSQQDVIKLYKQKGALYPTHNKIVCISMAFVHKGIINVRSIIGEQKFIVKEFCAVLNKNYIPCGYNIVGFDFPILRQKIFKEGLINLLPERFNDSNKKEWAFVEYNREVNIVDLMLYLKGTYFHNQSLAEACYLAGIPSPKNDEITGAEVSEYYYKGKLDDIRKYCERDVVATVNLFLKMQGEDIIDNITYKDPLESLNGTVTESNPLFDSIKSEGSISKTNQEKITMASKTLTADERQNLVLILKSCLGNREMSVSETKFLNSIWKN